MSIAKVKLATGNSCQNDISPSRKTYPFGQGKKSYSQTNTKMNTYASLRNNIEHRFIPLNKMSGLGRVLSALSGKFKTI